MRQLKNQTASLLIVCFMVLFSYACSDCGASERRVDLPPGASYEYEVNGVPFLRTDFGMQGFVCVPQDAMRGRIVPLQNLTLPNLEDSINL
jgi:hypothetical protein